MRVFTGRFADSADGARVADRWFFLMVALLCFNDVRVMGGWPTAKVLSAYTESLFTIPLIGLALHTAWCAVRGRVRLVALAQFAAYYACVLAVGGASIWVNRGTFVSKSGALGFEVWQFKSLVIDSFWYVAAAYLAFLWYRSRWREAMRIAALAVAAASVPIVAVAGLEVLGECGVGWAGDLANDMAFLANGMMPVSPDLANPLDSLRQYPGRVRSLFPEPSFLGIWAAGALPLSFSQHARGWRWRALTLCIVVLAVLSGSRMALFSLAVIMAGGLVLSLRVPAFWRETRLVLALGAVLAVGAVAVAAVKYEKGFAADVFVANGWERLLSGKGAQSDEGVWGKVSGFISGGSLGTRLKCNEVDLRVFGSHPVFGCGYRVRGMIFGDYIHPSERRRFVEINDWLLRQERMGRMNFSITKLSTITDVMAEFGTVGIYVVLFPLFAIAWRMASVAWRTRSAESGALFLCVLGIASTFPTCNVLNFLWVPLFFGLAIGAVASEEDGEGRREVNKADQ